MRPAGRAALDCCAPAAYDRPMQRPLEGVRVLDLSRVLAGPYCTMLLGDMGADVVKVESPQGDDTRSWGPPWAGGESAYYLCTNRNKRGITLNLRDPRAVEVVRRMAAASDIVVENFKAGTMERWGIGWEELHRLNPRLVYTNISGYGTTGPDATRLGYDFLGQAEGGWMSITGEPGGAPMKIGVALVDIVTGIFAASATIAALYGAARDGEGQRVDLSLFESAVATLANVGSNYLVSGQPAKRFGNAHPNIVPYQIFATADGNLALAIAADRQYARFCELAGVPHLAQPPYDRNADRLAHRDELIALLNPVLASKPTDEWMRLLEAEGIPAGVVRTVDQVFESPQAKARDMVCVIEHPTAGELRLSGLPYKLSATPLTIYRHPPLLGEHTDEVLAELGYTAPEVAALRAGGAV